MAKKELPPRPKTLEELYDVLVKTFPKVEHTKDDFINLMIKDMERGGLRTYSMRQWIDDQKMNLVIHDDWRLDDFQWGCIAYLRNLKIPDSKIKKLEGIFIFWRD